MTIIGPKSQLKYFQRVISVFVLVPFLAAFILSPQTVYARSVQTVLDLPAPGSMVQKSAGYTPTIVRGMTLHPENPLEFDFIIDTGDAALDGGAFQEEANTLIKYFLASLTVPEKDLWVNLSPYEKERIVPDDFGVTEMGRDLLAQDYLLKQLTASLLYPEEALGERFWQKIYKKAEDILGTANIPVNTFNKVWIVPDKAEVWEYNGSVFIIESHLKVMLEEDYLTLSKSAAENGPVAAKMTEEQVKDVNKLGSDILREVILPEIEKEVNEGQNFARLRQVYHSLILAAWYKGALKETLLGQLYVDQNKIKGIDLEDRDIKKKIYSQYLAAFQKGVYNYIKEDIDPDTQKMTPRKYFSGGFSSMAGGVTITQRVNRSRRSGSPLTQPRHVLEKASSPIGKDRLVTFRALDVGPAASETEMARTFSYPVKGVKTASSPIQDLMAERGTDIIAINQDMMQFITRHGFFPNAEVTALQLSEGREDVDIQTILSDPMVNSVYATSVAQALASILFAGQGKDGKEIGDGNAVDATHESRKLYVQLYPDKAVVTWASEGKRDASFFIELNRIYYSGYNETDGKLFRDFGLITRDDFIKQGIDVDVVDNIINTLMDKEWFGYVNDRGQGHFKKDFDAIRSKVSGEFDGATVGQLEAVFNEAWFRSKVERDEEIVRLRRLGVDIEFSADDGLEHTNALVQNIKDSWALAALVSDEYADIHDAPRNPVDDNSRIAGISFYAPDEAGVNYLDLPSVALPKIARSNALAQGLEENTAAFDEYVDNYINHTLVVMLGPRAKGYQKGVDDSGDHRNRLDIADAVKLQEKYPGLRLYTPGDGDYAAREVSSLGLDLDGYHMVTFKRSGSAEASMAEVVAGLVPNGQFVSENVSKTATADLVAAEVAKDYTDKELQSFSANGYSEADYMGRRPVFTGKGAVAMSAVTGASPHQFGPTMARLMKRINFDKETNTATVNTLLVTPDGASFILRTRLKSADIAEAKTRIANASNVSAEYVENRASHLGITPDEFVNEMDAVMGAAEKNIVYADDHPEFIERSVSLLGEIFSRVQKSVGDVDAGTGVAVFRGHVTEELKAQIASLRKESVGIRVVLMTQDEIDVDQVREHGVDIAISIQRDEGTPKDLGELIQHALTGTALSYPVTVINEAALLLPEEAGTALVSSPLEKVDDMTAYSAPGGIDLNLDLLDMQIKRDGRGIPLSFQQQPVENIHIEGLVPVIVHIAPVDASMSFVGHTN